MTPFRQGIVDSIDLTSPVLVAVNLVIGICTPNWFNLMCAVLAGLFMAANIRSRIEMRELDGLLDYFRQRAASLSEPSAEEGR